MSDKTLTVKEWQKLAADRGVKDSAATKALVKALAAAEKLAAAPAAAQMAVLDEVEAAGRALLKLHKGDRKLETFFEQQSKALQAARKAATASAEPADDEGAAWLEPKSLLRQLNLCRADPERNVHFAYVDGQDKAPGVMVMSPKLAAPALLRKLAAEVGAKTGACGTAWVQGTELMLQLDKPLGGLVKNLRAPIRASGFKVSKIVLWNADGTVFEQEAVTDGDEAPGPVAGAAAPVAAAGAPDAPPSGRSAGDLNARLKALLPQVLAVATTKEGQAAKLLASEAGTLARQGETAAAHASLDKVEKLLARLAAAAPAGTAAAAAPTQPAEALAPFDADAWRQARERWMQASEDVDDQLNDLRVAVLANARSEPVYAEALAEIAGSGLNAITARHRVQLAVALRELGEGDATRWQAHGPKALAAVRGFGQFIRSSPQIAACDANPFDVDVRLRETLVPALEELAAVLSAR